MKLTGAPHKNGCTCVDCENLAKTNASLKRFAEELKENAKMQDVDAINPSHYKFSDLEPIEVTERWKLGYNLGTVLKYLARAGKKDPSKEIEDLKKARWYLDRQISNLEKQKVDQLVSQKLADSKVQGTNDLINWGTENHPAYSRSIDSKGC